ncbi:MAG TPA: type I DNA topoisomerase [Alphaproteobacteria bacterium]
MNEKTTDTTNVVIVESPAKARTIGKYLGPGYRVVATYGHVCDLPSKDGSVRPDEDFAMDYVADPKSAKQLKQITTEAKGAGRLLLATDPDREGEAISWHVLNHLRAKGALEGKTAERVVFYEVTRDAVREALAHPRDIDMDLVNAQQARRALDYLVGFTLSPVLWRKVPGSRSAGRVQSVALRLIVDREMEIEAFKARQYWTVDAELARASGERFSARLVTLDGAKLDKFDLADEAAATRAAQAVAASALRVTAVERKQVRRTPPPPFTTSTLQQEAARKLGFTAQRTMRVAQRLYEGVDLAGETVGLISYMRTDSVTLSNEALTAARAAIERLYGGTYLPESPRRYTNRAKNAQEAHEAIRPTDAARHPRELAIGEDEGRLYELIWKRTVASQMEPAVLDQVGVTIASADAKVALRATGSVVAFDGYYRLYTEGRDEPAADDEGEGRRLPAVSEGEALSLGQVTPAQHFTEPPPRYSEASLVKRLEELGIGRPSTYANIITVLQDRDYVRLEKKRFVPEDRGRLVTAFLESFFERYVQYDFTARLEDRLDLISNGKLDWKDVLREFWSGFSLAVDDIGHLRVRDILDKLDSFLGPHIFPANGSGRDPRACPACADGRLSLKLGKFGAFVGCSNYPDCRYTRPLVVVNGGNGEGAGLSEGPRALGSAPDGAEVTLRSGPYGLYVQREGAGDGDKPKRVSLPKGMDPEAVDLAMAIALLDLPREVGTHPETGAPITAGVGRYGPYIKHQDSFKSLKDGDDVLTIGLNRAVALLAEAGGARRGSTRLRVLGRHPDDDREVALYSGRYGPYVRHNSVIANLPKDADPAAVTLADALPLLAEKAAKKTKGRKRAKPASTARKSTGKARAAAVTDPA